MAPPRALCEFGLVAPVAPLPVEWSLKWTPQVAEAPNRVDMQEVLVLTSIHAASYTKRTLEDLNDTLHEAALRLLRSSAVGPRVAGDRVADESGDPNRVQRARGSHDQIHRGRPSQRSSSCAGTARRSRRCGLSQGLLVHGCSHRESAVLNAPYRGCHEPNNAHNTGHRLSDRQLITTDTSGSRVP